jgi:hypothetical protein
MNAEQVPSTPLEPSKSPRPAAISPTLPLYPVINGPQSGDYQSTTVSCPNAAEFDAAAKRWIALIMLHFLMNL